jgi:hypothetical protein
MSWCACYALSEMVSERTARTRWRFGNEKLSALANDIAKDSGNSLSLFNDDAETLEHGVSKANGDGSVVSDSAVYNIPQ